MRELRLSPKDLSVEFKYASGKLTIFFIPQSYDYYTYLRILGTLARKSPRNLKIGTATIVDFKRSFIKKDLNRIVAAPFNVIPTACSACVREDEDDEEPEKESTHIPEGDNESVSEASAETQSEEKPQK